MQINLKTTGDVEFQGVCPRCHEHTTAGDSCCGEGAYVEGARVSDEEAIEAKEPPYVAVRLLTNVSEEKARNLKKAILAVGLDVTMFGHGQANAWNLNMFVPVTALPTREGK